MFLHSWHFVVYDKLVIFSVLSSRLCHDMPGFRFSPCFIADPGASWVALLEQAVAKSDVPGKDSVSYEFFFHMEIAIGWLVMLTQTLAI